MTDQQEGIYLETEPEARKEAGTERRVRSSHIRFDGLQLLLDFLKQVPVSPRQDYQKLFLANE